MSSGKSKELPMAPFSNAWHHTKKQGLRSSPTGCRRQRQRRGCGRSRGGPAQGRRASSRRPASAWSAGGDSGGVTALARTVAWHAFESHTAQPAERLPQPRLSRGAKRPLRRRQSTQSRATEPRSLLQLLLHAEVRRVAALLLAAVRRTRRQARVALTAHLLVAVVLLGQGLKRGLHHHHCASNRVVSWSAKRDRCMCCRPRLCHR